MNLRSWLRRMPQPVKLRVDGKDLAIPDSPRKWAEIEETIATLEGSKIEAFDASGTLLRATSLGDDGQVGETRAIAAPVGSSEIAQLGAIVTEACDRSALRHAEAYRTAFDAVVQLANTAFAQNHQLQLQTMQLQQANLELQARLLQAESGGEDGPLLQALAPMLGGPKESDIKKTNGKPSQTETKGDAS